MSRLGKSDSARIGCPQNISVSAMQLTISDTKTLLKMILMFQSISLAEIRAMMVSIDSRKVGTVKRKKEMS